MSPNEAVQKYTDALRDIGEDMLMYQFKVENGRISVGHVHGPHVDDVQWGMMWYTPEELEKAAKMRRLELGKGNPRKG